MFLFLFVVQCWWEFGDELLSSTSHEFMWEGDSCKEVGVLVGAEIHDGSFGEVLR